MYDNESGADGDAGVGQVEGRPVVGAEIKVQKVDDRAETQPVDDVAHRAAGDQCQSPQKKPLSGIGRSDEHGDDAQGEKGRAGQKKDPDQVGAAGHQTEGHAGVQDKGQVKKAGDKLDPLDRGQPMPSGQLGQLIGQDQPARGQGHLSPFSQSLGLPQ